MSSRARALIVSTAFVGCVLAANYVTTRYGMLFKSTPLAMTAGTLFAGATFVLRDNVHDLTGERWRRWMLALIVAGSLLSFLISAPFIALASAVAFALSESADALIYEPLRARGYIKAALASNAVGACVDTIVFLTIAGFPIRQALLGQLVGKTAVTLLALGGVLIVRWRRVTHER